MRILLSYSLSEKSPLYPGTPPVRISPGRSIAKGDTANTHEICASTHAGTHIDVPFHFCPEGRTVQDCLLSENLISHVLMVDIPPGTTAVTPEALAVARKFPAAEGVLVRTGMCRIRKADPVAYIRDYPGVDDSVPDFLRQVCPKIRFFGIDTISVSSPRNKETGRSCHRKFLCKNPEILILEDLDLTYPHLGSQPFGMTVYPLILAPVDGTPVMVFAELP